MSIVQSLGRIQEPRILTAFAVVGWLRLSSCQTVTSEWLKALTSSRWFTLSKSSLHNFVWFVFLKRLLHFQFLWIRVSRWIWSRSYTWSYRRALLRTWERIWDMGGTWILWGFCIYVEIVSCETWNRGWRVRFSYDPYPTPPMLRLFTDVPSTTQIVYWSW